MAIVGKGIVRSFGFHPERIQKNKDNIRSMLSELPTPFRKESGGGWSFLQACQKSDGTQWGEHRDMEALFCLGEAAGFVKSCLPREMWEVMPGGVPYYMLDI